ncbi:MAG: hypothetical protein JWO09_130 [Bacteroidetes bacterium]|nr:hypothetical protein [Bacteroidota bacterium]
MNFDPPLFDANVVVMNILSTLGNQERFRLYGIGITDANEKELQWKYNEQYKDIVFFEETLDLEAAREVKKEACKYGLQSLPADPINQKGIWKNVYVRKLLEKEVFELENPDNI